jgi:putative Holliday junction resolvase
MMGRIVAIDYGQKRTGLATTDALQIIATSIGTVPSGEVFGFLKKFVAENSVDFFVVGEARQMNNTMSESSRYIEPFVVKLRKEFPTIPVERMDERFTSLMATNAIREAGAKKKDRQNKALVDTVSAVILLQSYMEKKAGQEGRRVRG